MIVYLFGISSSPIIANYAKRRINATVADTTS